MSTAEAVVVVPDGIAPPDRRFWITEQMIRYDVHGLVDPGFSMSEVAKVFFGMSVSWLRLKMRPDDDHPDGYFVLDGEKLEFQRSRARYRVFSLFDIERMAYALAQQGSINAQRLTYAIMIVKAIARQHDLLKD